jgi:hypothetical protein
LENQPGVERPEPLMAASNIHYELTDRTRAIAPGGIGAIHLLAQRTGLVHDIDEGLHLLKRHQPYHESDHVLNLASNLLAGGSRLEHIEVRRNDEVYLDALGAQGHRIKMGMFSSLERFDLVEVHHGREGSTLASRRSNSWPATDRPLSRGTSRSYETRVSSALADTR